ncbi:MAG: DUF5658 family protein [Bdellovibrionota bacterium]
MALGLNKVEAAAVGGYYPVGDMAQTLPGAQRAFAVGCVLVLMQALDGLLTSLGVSRYGVAVEGNPLLRTLMEQFGHVPILGLVKVIAILFVIALSYYAKRLPWVQNAMGAISCIYLFTAIIPWTYILFFSSRM